MAYNITVDYFITWEPRRSFCIVGYSSIAIAIHSSSIAMAPATYKESNPPYINDKVARKYFHIFLFV